MNYARVTRPESTIRSRRLRGLLFVALAFAAGCGGAETVSQSELEKLRAKRREDAVKEAEAEAKAAEEHRKAVAAKKLKKEREREAEKKRKARQLAAQRSSKRKRSSAADDDGPPVQREQGPPLPEDTAAWNESHYRQAMARKDPRLDDALAELGKRAAGDQRAAATLAGLLDPAQDADGTTRENAPSSRRKNDRANRGLDPEQARKIAATLHGPGNQFAIETLGKPFTAGLTNADSKRIRDAILDTLVERPGRVTDAVLLRVLTGTLSLDLPPAEILAREKVEEEILKANADTAGGQFCVVLAQHAAGPHAPDWRRRLLEKYFARRDVRLAGAQILLCESPHVPENAKALLGGYLAGYASDALREAVGIPSEALAATASPDDRRRRASPREQASAPESAIAATRYLWSKRHVDTVAGNLYQVSALEEEKPLLALAAAMPIDKVRASLRATLKRNWQDGPDSLQSAGSGESTMFDFGLLVTMASLIGERRSPSSREAERLAFKSHQVNALLEARQRRRTMNDSWSRFHGRLLLACTSRLEAAALAKPAAKRKAENRPAAASSLPIELHEDARVVADFHLSWPQNLSPDVSAGHVSPLAVHYARVEERNRFRTVRGYYRRRLDAAAERAGQGGTWLHALRHAAEPGRVRSLDVVIRRADDTPHASAAAEERITVDVLSVEINDPRAGGRRR